MSSQNQELKVGYVYYCGIVFHFVIVTVEVSALLFMGDQLTVERARNTAKSRVTASSAVEALEGLQPAICDWHAVCVFTSKYIFKILVIIIYYIYIQVILTDYISMVPTWKKGACYN